MKRTILITAMLAVIILVVAGCNPVTETGPQVPAEEPEVSAPDINPVTGEPYADVQEKRGQQTNITDFDSLMLRLSAIEQYKYKVTDTAIDGEAHQMYIKGRYVRRVLNAQDTNMGETYDEVLMDRVTKQAFTHCGLDRCPKPNPDREVEPADYDIYYLPDPYETITKATDAKYIGDKMLNDQYTKVFAITYEGNPGRVWIQEYYGFPIRIEIDDPDGKRIIKYDEMMIDNTRQNEVDMPFNFTIKGEQGEWYFWDHYLGIWPNDRRSPEEYAGYDLVPFGV